MSAAEEIDDEILRLLTSAMRAADESFEKVGGGTRHYVRDCLWPEMSARGLAVRVREDIDTDKRRAVQAEREACARLVLRAETDARTQKGLRQQLSAIIEQRGIR